MNRQNTIASRLLLAGFRVRLLVWAVLTVVMVALASLAWTRNLERACTLKQWPVLPACADQTADAPLQVQSLRTRIAGNPGDSEAWIALAVLTSLPNQHPGVDHDTVLDMATRLAGKDYRVQRMQAARAIQRKLWPQTVDWLVRLVQDSHDGPAAVTLASLVREPQALAAMQTHIKPGAHWLKPVIQVMPQAGVPVVFAMPLVVKALPQQGLPPDMTQELLRQLKAQGQWLEAHALWTAWLGHPVDLLFNGDFEQGFIEGGFDWEVSPVPVSKAGALARQVVLTQHSGVLQVQFTGRPITVQVVRQHLMLLHPRYTLSGQFMTSKLRVNDGLAWSLQCAGNGREIARTPALKDTNRQWRDFKVDFEVPAGCGPAVTLQLQTFAPYEAVAGVRGQASFDDFKLEARP
ncbi:MAG: hypothetical protein JWR74_104 [Polaromonas sp.]|nr:hypothetical protein [Polaromonas sp.]